MMPLDSAAAGATGPTGIPIVHTVVTSGVVDGTIVAGGVVGGIVAGVIAAAFVVVTRIGQHPASANRGEEGSQPSRGDSPGDCPPGGQAVDLRLRVEPFIHQALSPLARSAPPLRGSAMVWTG
jgi:hypothetical protein